MWDFRKIEAFCKVCEQRSFSRAGETLFLSQPTISAHIQALERDFEAQLLDRMGRTVLPTPAGAVLYRYAKQAFSHLETARTEIRALAQEITGDLKIGSSNIPAYHVLPTVLTGFTRAHPKVCPSIEVASSETVTRRVLQGDLVAGIIGCDALPEEELFSFLLLESDIVLIAPVADAGAASSLPEGTRAEISFAEACSLNWILREDGSSTRRIFDEALSRNGHDTRLLRPILIVDSAHTAVQYVRSGLGVSIAARVAIRDALERRELREFSIHGVHSSRSFFCITNSRREPFPTVSAFLKYLQNNTRHLRSGKSRDVHGDSKASGFQPR